MTRTQPASPTTEAKQGGDVPEWAFERIRELENAAGGALISAKRDFPLNVAFARYIAAHEQPPVDPLEAEADQLASGHHLWADEGEYTAAISLALVALRRGIELGREQGQ